MKIYVVMKGEYSDRHVVCVTLNKEVAETMAERFTYSDDYGSCYIDEFEDAAEFIETRDVYEVRFFEDGSHTVTKMDDDDDYEWQKACDKNIGENKWIKTIWVNCFADNAEHAFKIACDRKAKYLAEKEGII